MVKQLGNAAFLDNAGCKHSCVNSQSRDINSLSVSISTVKLKKEKKLAYSFYCNSPVKSSHRHRITAERQMFLNQ